MLGLSMMVIWILVFLFIVALSVYMYWSRHKVGVSRTEFKVLSVAKALNEKNRVGQMNDVVARNRELVYTSRSTERLLGGEQSRAWSSLARYLCDDARDGAKLVEAERQNQVSLSKNTIDTMAYQYNAESAKKPNFFAAFWESSRTFVDEVNLGWVKNVESNALHPSIYPELQAFDESQKFFHKGSNLYRGNINAKLPAPDDDLDFKLSSLPAPVEGTVAQVRLIKPQAYVAGSVCYQDGKFVNNKLDQIPSALQIKQHMTVTVTNGEPQTVVIEGFGAAPGAAAPPQ